MSYEICNSPDKRMEKDIRFNYDDCDHDCRQNLALRETDWTEEHAEPCHEQWWERQVCGECLSEHALKAMREAA